MKLSSSSVICNKFGFKWVFCVSGDIVIYPTDVLMYHIVPGAYFSEGLRDGMWLPTLAQEQELLLRVTSDGYSRKWLLV